jgi:ATP-dependent DNA helicase RecG
MTYVDNIVGLVKELQRLGRETQWVEFKVGNTDHEQIGQYVSALANGAAHAGRSFGYLVWGIEDADHRIVGTSFQPHKAKVGNEDLENWLVQLLSPRVDLRFRSGEVDGLPIVVLEIPAALASPVQFRGTEHIRVGSYKKLLKDHPQIERELWRAFDRELFEFSIAQEAVSEVDVDELLDVRSYFIATKTPRPTTFDGVLEGLSAERMVVRGQRGGWDITNLGALCLARDLRQFGRLGRKSIRVVRYGDTGRTAAIGEVEFRTGYVTAFEATAQHIVQVIPQREVIDVLRTSEYDFPPVAIREILANTLIHQDFSARGAGPMVEIFPGRIEMSNPGAPLVDLARFVDSTPKSRNEGLASFMRRIEICEERGTGVDKVVLATEQALLPAPEFRAPSDSTIAVLFGPRDLTAMSRAERVRAVYLHTCLHVRDEDVTNTTIRQRFGVDSPTKASRLIAEAVDANLIRLLDPEASRRYSRYVPYWA